MYVCFWLTSLDNINLESYARNWQFMKISELGIRSFDLKLDKLSSIFKKEATVSDLLSPLFKNKWSWANWSRRFKKKECMWSNRSRHFTKEQPWANPSQSIR